MSWSERDIDSKKYQGFHILLRNVRLRTMQQEQLRKNAFGEAAESGPIERPERFQLQLTRLPSTEFASVHATPSQMWGSYRALSHSPESKDT